MFSLLALYYSNIKAYRAALSAYHINMLDSNPARLSHYVPMSLASLWPSRMMTSSHITKLSCFGMSIPFHEVYCSLCRFHWLRLRLPSPCTHPFLCPCRGLSWCCDYVGPPGSILSNFWWRKKDRHRHATSYRIVLALPFIVFAIRVWTPLNTISLAWQCFSSRMSYAPLNTVI